MKKIITLILALAMLMSFALTLASCNLSTDDQGGSTEQVKVIDVKLTDEEYAFVAKKGRISHAKAFMGKLIGVKPLGEFDYNGLTTVVGKAKGEKSAYTALLSYIEQTIENPEEQVIIIAHTNRRPQAERYKQLIQEKFNPKEIYLNDVYPSCGINIGPGLMAAYYIGKPISSLGLEEEKKLMTAILNTK